MQLALFLIGFLIAGIISSAAVSATRQLREAERLDHEAEEIARRHRARRAHLSARLPEPRRHIVSLPHGVGAAAAASIDELRARRAEQARKTTQIPYPTAS